MPRIGRIVAVGLPHHITQRGNYRQDVFVDDKDRENYLLWVQEYSQKFDLSILVYCLMQNHVHFIAIPAREDSLAKTFHTVHMRYSQYFNRKLKATGHLWQGRFYSCVLDEPHAIVAAKYIERNPVRAKMVKEPWQWRWSSALEHVNKSVGATLKSGDFFKITEMGYGRWKEYIGSKDDENRLNEIKRHTLSGRPLGSNPFIEELEKRFGRRLFALPIGRPKKREK